MVLLHGFALDHTSWDPQVPALAGAYRTIRYDLRGFGASSPPTSERDHVDDLLELMDLLGAGRAHLVGLSLGANLALVTALTHPDRVDRVVLASSGLPGHRWRTPRPPDEAAAHAAVHGVAAGRRFWLGHRLFEPARRKPVVRAHLHRMVAAYPGWEWRAELPQTALLPPVHDRLGELARPVLVIRGRHDLPGYQEIAGLLAAGAPGAATAELPDAGHLVNLESPQQFGDVVLGFLGGP